MGVGGRSRGAVRGVCSARAGGGTNSCLGLLPPGGGQGGEVCGAEAHLQDEAESGGVPGEHAEGRLAPGGIKWNNVWGRSVLYPAGTSGGPEIGPDDLDKLGKRVRVSLP